MTATRLDGRVLSKKIRATLAERIAEKRQAAGRPPGLGVILVGEDPGSEIYVRNKGKAAKAMGMVSKTIRLGADASQEQVLAKVEELNVDPAIDAYLVQLPLPKGMEEGVVTAAIHPAKDGDGLHPDNLGKLLCGQDAPRPCTPAGVMAMLDDAEISLSGKHAVVIGRSTIVGKPMALMLLERHCTVTICHSRTQDLRAELGRADIVVAAVGRPEMVTGDMLKPGACVVDVGINRVDAGEGRTKVVGDVAFDSAAERAGYLSPVPGGVGPMTITMLMQNAVEAWERTLLGPQ